MAVLDAQQRQNVEEIRQQLKQEPGLEHIEVNQNVNGEWLMSGTVVTKELREKAWKILYEQADKREMTHAIRNWDTVQVKPKPCRSTPWR